MRRSGILSRYACWGMCIWALGCLVYPVEGQMIVAHRGASDEAPENTLAAFRLAWERGADAIEGDFYLTKDGQIVTIHDRDTARTAGGVKLIVTDSTLAQLQALDVGAWKGDRYRGERMPTLEQVLAIVPAGKQIFIEIKSGPEIVPKLREVLEGASVTLDQVAVISFQEAVIVRVKQEIPRIKAFWLVGYQQDKATQAWSPSPDEVLRTLDRLGADGLDTEGNRRFVDQALADQLRQRGKEFHVWTIDKPADAQYFQSLGVDSITTNRPAEIRAALQAGR